MNSNKYLKARPPDCCMYSEEGSQFKIHRELLCQNEFLRKILDGAKDCCCSAIEIFCPCSDKELVLLVKFLYTGEIVCDDIDDLTKTIGNLKEIFGFPNELPLWPEDRDIPSYTSNHNFGNFIVKEQPCDQPESSYENDNNSNLQEPEIDLQKYSTCCNEKDPLEDATTTEFPNELPLWPEDQNLENNTSSNHDIPAFSVKEKPLVLERDTFTDQDENEIAFDSHESENDTLGNGTTEGVDFLTESNFEDGADKIETIGQTDAEKNSKARNLQKKLLKCDKCDASFLGKQALIYHIDKVHITCDYCKKAFKKKSQLLRHINHVHLKLQPYMCNECKKAFSEKENLKRHVELVHLKIKPFKCQHCKHSFGYKQGLQKHIIGVHQSLICRREDKTKK